MKVKTVALLSGLGMMLTSLSVWSLTRPGTYESDLLEPTPIAVDPFFGDRPAVSSQFTDGRLLMLTGRVGHTRLAADRDNETFVMLNVEASSDAIGSTPEPLNLAIVIDRSGSMKGKRIRNAVAAARGMVQRLRDGDVVSIVSYDTETHTLVRSTTIDSVSRNRVIDSIDDIEARGNTCISCGIDAGMEALSQRAGMVDRILLLSDGEPTSGVRDVAGFRRIASSVRQRGVSITSIGVDVDYNERIMAAVAQESNGHHYFVENPSGLPRIFDEELESLAKTVAKQSEIALSLAPGVELGEVFDRTFRRDGNRVLVPMGSFSAGETKTLLVRVRIPRGVAGERAVADVRMTYDDLGAGSFGECSGKLALLLSDDPSDQSPLDPLVEGRLRRSETASTLTEANRLFTTGDATAALGKLEEQRTALKARRRAAVQKAPKPLQDDVKRDFDRQLAAVDSASEGFAAPPAAGAAPAEEREKKAQVRRNQSAAFDMAF